jgi:Tfp pilus assembly protein PilN
MSRRRPGKRDKDNRVRQSGAYIALGCGVLLCAAVIVLTMAARIRITALSEETAALEEQIRALKIEYDRALARHEEDWSLERIASAAGEMHMLPPGRGGAVFLRPPDEDLTVYYDNNTGQTG